MKFSQLGKNKGIDAFEHGFLLEKKRMKYKMELNIFIKEKKNFLI